MYKLQNLLVFQVLLLLLLSCIEKPVPVADVESILKNIKSPEFSDRQYVIDHEKCDKDNCHEYINWQIDECSKNGGGRVILSPGRYFCKGPLNLKSNVNLHLEKGARVMFSQDPDDYLPVVFVRWEGTEVYNYSPFIYANNVSNIAITGEGIIDGNGLEEKSFRAWRSLQKADQRKLREMGRAGVPVSERIFGEGHYLRPQLIHLINCNNILIEGITIINGSFWLIQPTYCNNITIRGIVVNSNFINNDGVDLDSDSNVLIENCSFNIGDDFVAIKSGRDQDGWRVNKPCRNIVIRNCTSKTCLHGISFGSEISGGVENVYAENLIFKKIRQNGLQFKSNKDRGGYIRNIVLDNIRIDTTETGISFTNNYHSYSGGDYPSAFENIKIKNLECQVVLEKAISIQGLPEMPITNVELDNISFVSAGESSVITNVRNIKWNNVSF